MLASWVRPDRTSLPITNIHAVGLFAGMGVPLQEIAQQGDQRLVRRRHLVLPQPPRAHPCQSLLLLGVGMPFQRRHRNSGISK